MKHPIGTMKHLVLTVVALVWSAVMVHAQPYAIDWHKVGGGAASSAGGVYALTGTIGQAAAGSMIGGNYSLTGGFWSCLLVVEVPGGPTLYLSRDGDSVRVYWQDVPNWILQENDNLAAPTAWSASSGVTNANGTNTLTLANPSGIRFFRLYKP